MNYLRKLTKQQVDEIRRRYKAGDKQTYLASLFSVTQSSISRIINRHSWRLEAGMKP